ncbi:MAG TPA: hypothetical protein VK504_30645 [Vicinamibacterales bacterium]|nr:hypothetical protein [Vicinamibacterales bacterium]
MTKNPFEVHYLTGEEIHIGDRVLFSGHPAIVVVVIGRNEYAPGYPREGRSNDERGFVMRTDDGQMYMYEYADEDIKLLSRGEASPHPSADSGCAG